jgi:F0F1-type ATP synthase delta subunit
LTGAFRSVLNPFWSVASNARDGLVAGPLFYSSNAPNHMERTFTVSVASDDKISDKEADKISKTLQKSLTKYFKKGYEIKVE